MATPDDIHPQTGCRLPPIDPRTLDPEGRAIFALLTSPDGGTIRGLRGPGGIGLNSPAFSKVNRPLTRFLKSETGVSPREREVAVLATARCCANRFEWAAHEAEAVKAGVPRETMEAIRRERPSQEAHEDDRVIVDLARAIFQLRHVPAPLYQAAHARFGTARLVNLVAIMGSFASTAAILTAFDMQLDEGVEPAF